MCIVWNDNEKIKFIKLIYSSSSSRTTTIIMCDYLKCWLIQMPLAVSSSFFSMLHSHSIHWTMYIPCNCSGIKIIKEMNGLYIRWLNISHLTCLLLSFFILISAILRCFHCVVYCYTLLFILSHHLLQLNFISTTNHKISSSRKSAAFAIFFFILRTYTTEIKSNIIQGNKWTTDSI